jgi:O-antigen/teichoic acid export membrane protein
MTSTTAPLSAFAQRLRARGWRSFGWGLIDQALSSATTLVLTIAGGRIAGAGGLGVVVIGWSGYLLALVLQRALVTRPLVSISTTAVEPHRRDAARRGLTAAVVWAACATSAFVAGGLVVPGEIGRGLLILSPWVAVGMLQDYWRTLLFRDGRGSAAAANDATWLVVFCLLTVPAWIVSTDAAVAAAWGGGALAAASLGFVQTRLRPAGLHGTWSWWRRDVWPFSRWLSLEGAYYSSANAGITVIVDKTLGPAAVGGLRAAQSAFAPLTLINPAIALPGLPALVRAVAVSPRAALALALRLSAAVLALTAAYVVLMVWVGSSLLPIVLGASFEPYRELALPIGIWQGIGAAGVGLTLLLTARRRGRELLAVRLVESTAIVATIWFLSARHGLEGAAWGYAAGAGLGLLTLAILTLRVQQEALRAEQPPATAPAPLLRPSGAVERGAR